jgi:hypothetical protein
MKDRDLQKHKPGFDSEKQPYEPPKATLVRVQLEERVLGCLYSSMRVCGLTE